MWYNLNSKNSDGPQIISDFYLSAFISGIEENGYQVFVIEGKIPDRDPQVFGDSLRKHQKYYTVSQIKATQKKRIAEGTNDINVSGYDKRDL